MPFPLRTLPMLFLGELSCGFMRELRVQPPLSLRPVPELLPVPVLELVPVLLQPEPVLRLREPVRLAVSGRF